MRFSLGTRRIKLHSLVMEIRTFKSQCSLFKRAPGIAVISGLQWNLKWQSQKSHDFDAIKFRRWFLIWCLRVASYSCVFVVVVSC